MLQRSEGGSTPAEETDCDDPAIALACSLESDACPAACRENSEEEKEDEVVKSGSLVVSSSAADDRVVVVSSAGKANAVSDLDTLTFKTSEEVTLSKVVLENYGFSNASALIADVWLEDEDGNKITTDSKSKPNNKGITNLTLKKDYKVVDGNLNATIVVETVAGATVGGTLGFKVSDVVSTAKDVDLGNYKAYKYDVVEYDGTAAKATTRGGDKDYNYEAGKTYEIAKFKIKAPDDSAIVVSNFTLKNVAAAPAVKLDAHEFLDVDSIEVTVAGKSVKATASINKDQELTISLKDIELAAKENAEFVVSAGLNDEFDEYGKSFQFKLTKVAATNKNNARISIDSTPTCATYTFNGGKLKFTSNKLGNVDAAINSTNVLIADGTVTVGEAVEGTWTLTISGKGFCTDSTKATAGTCAAPAKWLYPADIITEIRLAIAGDEIDWTFNRTDKENVEVTFKDVDLTESGKVKVYVDIDDEIDYQNQTLTFSSLVWNLTYSDANSSNNTVDDISGTVSVSKLNITPSKATLTNSISSDEVEFKAGEIDTKEIFKGTYTAKKNDINLNKFTLSATGIDWAWSTTAASNNKLTAYLYLGSDASSVADKQLSCTGNATAGWFDCEASDTFTNVLVKAGESIDVRVEAEIDSKVVKADAVKFNLTLEWEDVEGNPNSGVATKATAKISIVKMWTPEIETGKAKATVLLRGSSEAIAEFTVKPSSSSSMDLESVEFNVSGTTCNKLKLTVDGTTEDLVGTTTCKASGFVREVNKEGIVVKVEFDDEPAFANELINAKVTGLKLNGVIMSNEFSKAYADATIKFSQVDNKSYTKYTIEDIAKYNGSTQVSDLHLYNKAWAELATSLNGGSLAKGDTFTIDNLADSERIEKIVYTVTQWTKTQTVVVEYSRYPDYFVTTNADDLRVYANGKDNDGAGVTNKAGKTGVIITAETETSRYWRDISTLQDNVVISNGKITWNIKYVASYGGTAGFDNNTHYFIALKVASLPAGKTCKDVKIGSSQLTDDECWAVLYLPDTTTLPSLQGKTLKVEVDSVVDEYDLSDLVRAAAPTAS